MDWIVTVLLLAIVIIMMIVLETFREGEIPRQSPESLKSRPRTMTLTQARINRARKKLTRKR